MDEILMQLERLNQYSMESKLLGCEKYAQRLMDCDSLDLSILATGEGVAPTELEIFSLFSIVFDTGATTALDTKTFSEIITAIRNYWHPKLYEAVDNGNYADSFMMICGLTQFAVQGNIIQRLYRYHYFFHYKNENVDMVNEFALKFGCDYDEYEIFAFALHLIFSMKADTNPSIPLTYIFNKYKQVKKSLTIETKTFIEELQKLYANNYTDYFFGLKIQYLYPLIDAPDGVYIPLPYLLINATTESLLNRLTEGNNALRRSVGKNVIENYLFDIYSELPALQAISAEITYKVGRNILLSPDVMVVENDCCIMFDTKAIVPNIKLREFSQEKIKETVSILAEFVLKLYKHMNNFLCGRFSIGYEVRREDLFGVVVILEDCFISRKQILDCAISMIETNTGTLDMDTKNHIYSNVKIISLREIESFVLQRTSYLQNLVSQRDDSQRWFDMRFGTPTIENGVIDSLADYLNVLKSKYIELIKEASRPEY